MKFLLLLVVIAVAAWAWRSSRTPPPTIKRTPSPPPPQDMVVCAWCGVHVPRADSVGGRDGVPYCCAEHRQRAES
jgi:uncharacterized protein